MRYQELLKRQGFIKRSDGKFINPNTGRGMRLDLAKDAAAKAEGFKSYKALQDTSRSSHYKKFLGWYNKAHLTEDKPASIEFNKVYSHYKAELLKANAGKKYDKEAFIKLLQITTYKPSFQKERYQALYML